MQGTVRSVDVAVGDEVTAHTRVAVLEAMKMENNLLAGIDGVVNAVHVGAGDNVAPGTLLVEVRRSTARRASDRRAERATAARSSAHWCTSTGSLVARIDGAPMTTSVRVDRDGGVAEIVLARPDRRNALDYAAVLELVAALHEVEADDSVGAVLLRGDGRSFCAGGDLSEFRDGLSSTAYDFHRGGEGWAELMLMIPSMRTPVVVAPHGHALAGGCGIVAAADVAIAAEGTVFATSEITIGLFPIIVYPTLATAIGARAAREMALTGRRLDAAEALRVGLVHRVVDADQHLAVARAPPPPSSPRSVPTRSASASGSCARSPTSRWRRPRRSPSRRAARSWPRPTSPRAWPRSPRSARRRSGLIGTTGPDRRPGRRAADGPRHRLTAPRSDPSIHGNKRSFGNGDPGGTTGSSRRIVPPGRGERTVHVGTWASRVPPSGIREIVNLVIARPDSGIVRLEIGEPDLPIEPHVVAAAQDAAARGIGYTQSFGIGPLREAITARLARLAGLTYTADEIVITQGGGQAVSLVFSALLDAGDEVLVPDPAWPNYVMSALLRGAVPVPYQLRPANGFLPDLDELRSLITERTRLIVLNSPANPTGAVVPATTVAAIVELAAAHGIWVLSDEVYDELVFEGEMANAAQYDREHVVGVYSFSKTYSMTGWRVGYTASPRPLARLLGTLQEPTLSCISAVSQHAALAALEGPQQGVADKREIYRGRRDLVSGLLADGGFDAVRPAGAFYQMVPLAPAPTADSPPSTSSSTAWPPRRAPPSATSPPTSCACRSPPRRRRCAPVSSVWSPGARRPAPALPGRAMTGMAFPGHAGRTAAHSLALARSHRRHGARMIADPAVRLRSIHKSFGPNEVLKGVDLLVSPGEHVVVFGPSGSGKSTLLRTINLLEPPTSGSVQVYGTEYGPGLPGERRGAAGRSSCAAPSAWCSSSSTCSRTSAPSTTSPSPCAGRSTSASATRASAPPSSSARSACCPTWPSSPTSCPAASSSAWRSPGRLAMDPKVMLFDEPTSALDPELVGEVLATMRQVAALGMTMVVVTHEMGFAREIGDLNVFMDDGCVVEQGGRELFASAANERTRKFIEAVL